MRLFGKKKAPELNARQEAMAVRLAERLVSLQRRVADRLNLWTADISSRGWLAILIVFCVVVSVYLLREIIRALN